MTTSIIILTYNALEHTRMCIDSIRRFTPPVPYELIVVDHASDDGTVEWLGQQDDVKLIANEENNGFPAGCNQGLAAASGDYLLLLNNDTVVTPRWLEQLLACLDSDGKIGAVGPVTNAAAYYSAVSAPYRSMDELLAFAEQYNRPDPSKWMRRIKLIGFCLLMKREVYETVGDLDERFTPGNFEDDDYCLRIGQAGYRLILCGDTFIHHQGSVSFGRDPETFSRLLQINAGKFASKWGFDPTYSTNIRYDLLSWLRDLRERPLKVLEVGCACGATLLELKNHFPRAETFGLELNPQAAAIAATVCAAEAGNIETADLPYADASFDYIIFGDVLEHLKEPWEVLKRAARLLKPSGKVLASIPNVGHYSVIQELVRGRWTYTDRGLLDITHLRFFTLESIGRLFKDSGLGNMLVRTVQLAPSPQETEWIGRMAECFGEEMKKHWMPYQYIVKAGRSVSAAEAAESASYTAFKRALRGIEWDVAAGRNREMIIRMWEGESVGMEDAARFMERDSVNPERTAAALAQFLTEAGLYRPEDDLGSGLSEWTGGKRGEFREST